MESADRIRHILSNRDRLILGSPLWAARLFIALEKEAMSLRPNNWEEKEDDPPVSLIFNLSEFCNAKCSFCIYKKTKPRGYMDNRVFFKAAGEYHAAGGKRIGLSALIGEPLLDPSFFEKTAFLRSLGDFDSIELTTNGILLAQEGMVEALLESGISKLHISTGGFEKEMYERAMGVSKYDEFLYGATGMLEKNEESGSPISIEFDIRGSFGAINTEDFLTEILPFIDSSGGAIKISFRRLFADWLGQIGSDGLPKDCGFIPITNIRARPCQNSFFLAALVDGDLRLCASHYSEKGIVDEFILGNIREESLMDVWGSEATRSARRSTCGAILNEMCKKCLWYMPCLFG